MANNYYDMTGVLMLEKVTPVIEALFGTFGLDDTYPGAGEAYIAQISEGTDCSWDAVHDALYDLAETLELDLADETVNETEKLLAAIIMHFGDEQASSYVRLADSIEFEDDARLDHLFDIAMLCNDGHGLKGFKTESAWHCSKPRLFEFGGFGQYRSHNVHFGSTSSEIVRMGQDLDNAIQSKNLDQCAARIFSEFERILNSVQDDGTRNIVKQKVAAMMTSSTTQN